MEIGSFSEPLLRKPFRFAEALNAMTECYAEIVHCRKSSRDRSE
jgi:hypothetical protein